MIPYLGMETLKAQPYRVAHIYLAHIWEQPPPGSAAILKTAYI